MSEFQEKSIVRASIPLSDTVYRLHLYSPQIAAAAKPGHFVMLRTGQTLDPLLRRPFSLYQVTAEGEVHILYKVVGKGTSLLPALKVGSTVDLLGPLGKGFSIQSLQKNQGTACLIGGGMGIAPIFFLAKHLAKKQASNHQIARYKVLLGASQAQELAPLVEDFQALGYTVLTATDDGSMGHHGFITQLIPDILDQVSHMYTCGPTPMMAAVAALAQEAGLPCQASLETHMACGLGACLGCTVHGSNGGYKHVCKDGPVLNAEEVAW